MRIKVQELLLLLQQARELIPDHNLSLGYIGEEILRTFLKDNIPSRYKVTQGFISDGSRISPQCDIIIYDCGKYTPFYSYGTIDIIPAKSVVATIEVKTSINRQRFCEVLRRFEELYSIGVATNYIFTFSFIRPQTLRNYFYLPQAPQIARAMQDYDDEYDSRVCDTAVYDVDDYQCLPKAIVVLENGYCLQKDHIQTEQNDSYGYAAYQLTDGYNKEIASLQIFMSDLLSLIEHSDMSGVTSPPPLFGNSNESLDDIQWLQYKYCFQICNL